MPSSISNSNDRLPAGPGGRMLLLAAALALSAIAGLEGFWRSSGYAPSVVDDVDLWCVERDKVERAGGDTVILIGQSRMQQGFVREAFQETCPGRPFLQLARFNWNPLASLRDIALNTSFEGTVVCDLSAQNLLPDTWYEQPLPDPLEYYAREWSLNKKANRLARTLAQGHLALVYPDLALQYAAPDLLRGEWPVQWIWTCPDRTQIVDYTKPDIAAFTKSRTEEHRDQALRAIEFPSYSRWPEPGKLAEIERWVKAIHDRGGYVVFVRCVTSGGFWELDQRYFPRARFWDAFAGLTSAETIHFQDLAQIAGFQCAEGSHLYYDDAKVFTKVLFEEITERGALRPLVVR